MPVILQLALIGAAAGIALLYLFRSSVDQTAVRQAQRRIRGHLYELMLYADEPALIWRAHCDLLAANVRYLALMLKPAALSLIPMLALLAWMDSIYGRLALKPGEETLVTMHLKAPGDLIAAAPDLRTSSELAVETPAVRQIAEGQVSWRVRAVRHGSGKLEFALPQGTVEKRVEVGSGLRSLTERRSSSILGFLQDPGESLLTGSAADWIEVRYPRTAVTGFGLEFHWLIWFLAFSFVSMMALKRRLGVSF